MKNEQISKAAIVKKQALDAEELRLINVQSLRELSADEVFTFKIAACDNTVDRDFERFTDKTLDDLSKMYVGKTVIVDHRWSAGNQSARIYAATVEDIGNGIKQLVLRTYMFRNDASQPMIEAIEAGILREVSVSCAIERGLCSICGKDRFTELFCGHFRGETYAGVTCHVDLDGATDAYEVSFVAVPAQPGAGVKKRYANEPDSDSRSAEPSAIDLAKARLELEKHRFGGI